MVNEIFVNDLIGWKQQEDNTLVERVLWIDDDYIMAFVLDFFS